MDILNTIYSLLLEPLLTFYWPLTLSSCPRSYWMPPYICTYCANIFRFVSSIMFCIKAEFKMEGHWKWAIGCQTTCSQKCALFARSHVCAFVSFSDSVTTTFLMVPSKVVLTNFSESKSVDFSTFCNVQKICIFFIFPGLFNNNNPIIIFLFLLYADLFVYWSINIYIQKYLSLTKDKVFWIAKGGCGPFDYCDRPFKILALIVWN